MNSENKEKTSVLLVDDEPTNLNVMSRLWAAHGFDVFIAKDGESAINRAENIKPDIILLDIQMPKMDGFEACRRLKENEKTKEIPIIFMSGLSDVVDKVRGFELGAVD